PGPHARCQWFARHRDTVAAMGRWPGGPGGPWWIRVGCVVTGAAALGCAAPAPMPANIDDARAHAVRNTRVSRVASMLGATAGIVTLLSAAISPLSGRVQ